MGETWPHSPVRWRPCWLTQVKLKGWVDMHDVKDVSPPLDLTTLTSPFNFKEEPSYCSDLDFIDVF